LNQTIRRFLLTLTLVFSGLAVVSWSYNAWHHVSVSRPCLAWMDQADAEGLVRCAAELAHPHIYSGYEVYTGFGPERTQMLAQKANGILRQTTLDYSADEQTFLIHEVPYYLAAFQEQKASGEVPLVPGDRVILSTVLLRHTNAVRSGLAFSIYASLAALLFAAVTWTYLRRGGLLGQLGPAAK
jgi:hypothetical protein